MYALQKKHKHFGTFDKNLELPYGNKISHHPNSKQVFKSVLSLYTALIHLIHNLAQMFG